MSQAREGGDMMSQSMTPTHVGPAPILPCEQCGPVDTDSWDWMLCPELRLAACRCPCCGCWQVSEPDAELLWR